MTHRISVIIPSYQHAKTISACLDHIFDQTLLPAEVIVVNDGSTDDTIARLESYANRIKLINQANQGGNAARNNGFNASTGDLVIFCDADALMRPDMLEKLAQSLDQHPEAGYAYSGFRFGWKSFRSFPFDAGRLRCMNFIHTSALIRRADFPGFDQAIKRFQDWDLWLTMLENGKSGVWVDEELFRIVDARDRKGISQWRPSIMYKIPWKRFGIVPASVEKYNTAREVITQKHNLRP